MPGSPLSEGNSAAESFRDAILITLRRAEHVRLTGDREETCQTIGYIREPLPVNFVPQASPEGLSVC